MGIPILGKIFGAGIKETLDAGGAFAKNLRTAITGDDPLTAEQKFELLKQAEQFENGVVVAQFELQKAQIEVNKVEAASQSLFKSGWRPATGWTCVGGLAYQVILRPVVPWLVGLFHAVPSMPPIELDTLLTLLFALLGLGSYRSYEYVKGVPKG